MSVNINLARSAEWPHLTEEFNFPQQTIKCECHLCGTYRYLQWLRDPLELDVVCDRMSFVNRHKHEDLIADEEWPEILIETTQ